MPKLCSYEPSGKAVKEKCRQVLPEKILGFIEECAKKPYSQSCLIAVLHEIQDHFGYLDHEHLEAVAQLMQIPAAKVSGVASFYHYFRLKERGRFTISVCMGTACYVKHAESVAKRLKEELGIEFGETTEDGLFTLEESRCLGTCALAPVVKIGDDIHANMTPDKVPALLVQYTKKEEKK